MALVHKFLVILFLGLAPFVVQSQIISGKYPTPQDSIECLQLMGTYKHLIIQKEYDLAIGPWRKALLKCPGSNLSLYIDGVKILKNKIETEKSKAVRLRYVDTLIFVYDQRIKYFGHDPVFSTSYIFGLMGLDLQQYRPEAYDEAYHYFSQCFSSQQKQTLPSVMVGLMKSAVAMNKAKLLDADSIVFFYKNSVEYAQAQLKATVSSDKREVIAEALILLEDIYLTAGLTDCETLVQTLKPRFDAAPYDPKVVKRVANILDKSNCHGTELFKTVSQKLYSMDSTSANALLLARQYATNNEALLAIKYFKRAISLERDSARKAQILVEAGTNIYQRFGRYGEAKLYFTLAKSYRPKWSQPLLGLSRLYAAAAKTYSSNAFENTMLYWAAADKLNEALKIEPNLIKTIEEEVQRVNSNFPPVIEIAAAGYKLGETVMIKGWVAELTIVRARKE
jgi:tetratricopeptide (TPR) repeat protein